VWRLILATYLYLIKTNNKMTQSKLIEILMEEHKNILRVAEAVEKECDLLGEGKAVDEGFFTEVIDFIRNYADKFHHAKEEDILFKELCQGEAKEKMHCNPVEQMLHEHEEGRSFVKELEEGIKEKNKSKVAQNARSYVQLIRDHISKEDNILYMMADEVLDDEIKAEILKKFKTIAKERAEQGKKYLDFVRRHRPVYSKLKTRGANEKSKNKH
jgi:hemerythrin-like domain-containing protein